MFLAHLIEYARASLTHIYRLMQFERVYHVVSYVRLSHNEN